MLYLNKENTYMCTLTTKLKRSKVSGELLDARNVDGILDECTAGAGKIYCITPRDLEDK